MSLSQDVSYTDDNIADTSLICPFRPSSPALSHTSSGSSTAFSSDDDDDDMPLAQKLLECQAGISLLDSMDDTPNAVIRPKRMGMHIQPMYPFEISHKLDQEFYETPCPRELNSISSKSSRFRKIFGLRN
jgi:hypothetical protein